MFPYRTGMSLTSTGITRNCLDPECRTGTEVIAEQPATLAASNAQREITTLLDIGRALPGWSRKGAQVEVVPVEGLILYSTSEFC
jgi:hypothetical protein